MVKQPYLNRVNIFLRSGIVGVARNSNTETGHAADFRIDNRCGCCGRDVIGNAAATFMQPENSWLAGEPDLERAWLNNA